MALPGSALLQSGIKSEAYCRKQKSLGRLCSNFLSLYNRVGVDSIGLDAAARELGVERRRIYDIVNVLESVGVLSRKGKNQYSWKGFGGIPEALNELKEEGLGENLLAVDENVRWKTLDDEEDLTFCDSNPSSQQDQQIGNTSSKSPASLKADIRREKSLGQLTQNFVKLFLCSNENLISLDEAATVLLGDAHSSSNMRTKVRRLYDIANVLSSMNLIQKVRHTHTRKPAFRWLGVDEKFRCESFNNMKLETKKRAFGSEITNSSLARNNVDFSPCGHVDEHLHIQVKVKREIFEDVRPEKESKQGLKSYQFGPFAPAGVPTSSDSQNKPVHAPGIENLSTHHPQYHNQALKDLFVHYMEAWKSWYSEVIGEKTI